MMTERKNADRKAGILFLIRIAAVYNSQKLLNRLGDKKKNPYLVSTKHFDYEILLFAFGGDARVRECRRAGNEKIGAGII